MRTGLRVRRNIANIAFATDMDRLMARVGLSGRAFIPLLSSFACAVPGIMATRTIEDHKDRLTTILRTDNAARLDYALALANLRYATGTVVEPTASTHTIDQTLFTTAPFEWGN